MCRCFLDVSSIELSLPDLRNEFINNWTSHEFVAFVDKLGDIIDERISEEVRSGGDEARKEFLKRAEEQWRRVLAAETGFWPSI